MTKTQRRHLLIVSRYAAKIDGLIHYFNQTPNPEQREATWYELMKCSDNLNKSLFPFDTDLRQAIEENEDITDSILREDYTPQELKKAYNKVNDSDSEVEEDLSFIKTPEDLLNYLNNCERDDEEECGGVATLPYKETEEVDLEQEILKNEIRRRLLGETPTKCGDDYPSLEKEKLIEDSVKAIQIINDKIAAWNLYKDSKGIWRRGRPQ